MTKLDKDEIPFHDPDSPQISVGYPGGEPTRTQCIEDSIIEFIQGAFLFIPAIAVFYFTLPPSDSECTTTVGGLIAHAYIIGAIMFGMVFLCMFIAASVAGGLNLMMGVRNNLADFIGVLSFALLYMGAAYLLISPPEYLLTFFAEYLHIQLSDIQYTCQ